MSKVKVPSVSEWVSEWQGHLLSCCGQLKTIGRGGFHKIDKLRPMSKIWTSVCVYDLTNSHDRFLGASFSSESWLGIEWCDALQLDMWSFTKWHMDKCYFSLKFWYKNSVFFLFPSLLHHFNVLYLFRPRRYWITRYSGGCLGMWVCVKLLCGGHICHMWVRKHGRLFNSATCYWAKI